MRDRNHKVCVFRKRHSTTDDKDRREPIPSCASNVRQTPARPLKSPRSSEPHGSNRHNGSTPTFRRGYANGAGWRASRRTKRRRSSRRGSHPLERNPSEHAGTSSQTPHLTRLDAFAHVIDGSCGVYHIVGSPKTGTAPLLHNVGLTMPIRIVRNPPTTANASIFLKQCDY